MDDDTALRALRTQLALAADAGSLSVSATRGAETPWVLSDVKHDPQRGARALERHELGWRPPPSRHAALVDAVSGAEPAKSMNRPVIDRHSITDVQQEVPTALPTVVVSGISNAAPAKNRPPQPAAASAKVPGAAVLTTV